MDHSSEDLSNIFISIMMVGASGVGKTSAVMNYIQEHFYTPPARTLAVDCWVTTTLYESKLINLKIYDSPGIEDFASSIAAYWNRVNAIILCVSVDISNSIQFIQDIHTKYSSLYRHTQPSPLYILAVVKSDMTLDSQFENQLSELSRWGKIPQELIYKVTTKNELSIKNMIDGVISSILTKNLYSHSNHKISTKGYIKSYIKNKRLRCKCQII